MYLAVIFICPSAGTNQQYGGYFMGASHDHKQLFPGHTSAMASLTQIRDKNIKVKLENRELWSRFHQRQTEMIITKTGR